jgi:hypothetical protein
MRSDDIAHLPRVSEHEQLRATVLAKAVIDEQLHMRINTEGIRTLLPSLAAVVEYGDLVRSAATRARVLHADAF